MSRGAARIAAGEPVVLGDRLRVLVALQRRFRAWAVWVDGSGQWTATRARPYRSGDPLGPQLLWLRADDHADLAARMREYNDG